MPDPVQKVSIIPKFLRGALVEYKSDFLGPIPNIVIFQFNPESLTRTIQIPSRTTSSASAGSRPRESNQAGDSPYEKISLTAHFCAADQLNIANPVAITFGVGPQLAALEKMAYPISEPEGTPEQAVDAVADAASANNSSSEQATSPTPRQRYPNVLFIWGGTKILPVIIDSLIITEKQFDGRLNPIQAEVSLGLSVMTMNRFTDDQIARGAAKYSNGVKDTQAVANMASTALQPIIELIPF